MVWVLTTRAKFSVSRMVLRTPSSVSRLTLLNTLLFTFSTGSSRLTFPCHTLDSKGGFNVSNLMGSIGERLIIFYFLQNVWECRVFFAFSFKVGKKCDYDWASRIREYSSLWVVLTWCLPAWRPRRWWPPSPPQSAAGWTSPPPWSLHHINSNMVFTVQVVILTTTLHICAYVIQHCFICRPSDLTEWEDAGTEPRAVATLALTARRS